MIEELSEEVDASIRLQAISTLLIQEGNLEALYERVLDAAIGLMSADIGSMQKYDPERDQLRLLAWQGVHAQLAAFWEWISRDSPTSCGMALSLGRRIIVPDIEFQTSSQARLNSMRFVEQAFGLCTRRLSSRVRGGCWA